MSAPIPSRLSFLLIRTAALGCFLVGTFGVWLGTLPLGRARAVLSTIAGRTLTVTPAQWSGYSSKLTTAFAVIGVVGVVGGVLSRRLATAATAATCRLSDDRRQLVARCGAALRRDGRWPLVAVALLTLLAAALRLVYLHQSIRYDEAMSFLRYAQKDVLSSWAAEYLPNNHILNTLLMKLCAGAFGNAEVALRFPAFLAGVALVPAVYFVARASLSWEMAVIAASLTAVDSFLIEYSALARGYSMLALTAVLAAGFVELVRRYDNYLAWVGFTACIVLGGFTIPTMLYPAVGLYAYLFLAILAGRVGGNRTRMLKRCAWSALACAAAGVVLYTPVFLISGVASVTSNRFVTAPEDIGWTAQLVSVGRELWSLTNRDRPIAVAEAVAVTAVIGSLPIAARGGRVPLLLILLFSAVLVTRVQGVVGFPRIWIYLIPFYFIAAASSLRFLPPGRFTRVLIAACITVVVVLASTAAVLQGRGVVDSNEIGAVPAAPEAVRKILTDYSGYPGVFAWVPASMPVEYYLRRSGSHMPVNPRFSGAPALYVTCRGAPDVYRQREREWLATTLGRPLDRVQFTELGQCGAVSIFELKVPPADSPQR